MKTQTTLTLFILLLCLTLLPARRADAQNGAAPSTTACGTVTAYTPGGGAAGALTIGGATFAIAPGVSLSGVAVGANVCATFCFNSAGQIAGQTGTATVQSNGPRICGTVIGFSPAYGGVVGQVKLGGATLSIRPGFFLPGQSLVATGANVCVAPLFDGAGQLTFGSSFFDAPGTLQLRVPAITHGQDDAQFRLPSPFVLAANAPPAGASVYAVTTSSFGSPLGFDATGVSVFAHSAANSTVRAASCADSLWDLVFALSTNGATEGDMVTLALTALDGSSSQVVAMFTIINGAAVLTQIHPDIKLLISGNQARGVGHVIPFSISAGSSGMRTPLLALVFSMSSKSLNGCFSLVAEIKRAGGGGTTGIALVNAVVKRVERFGDREGSIGSSIDSGSLGWFPTGLPCAVNCGNCQPPPPPVQPGSLCGYVYCDKNNDGVKQSDEAGISGVTITLSGTASRTTTTDGNGFYIFNNLPPGTYTITETQPANAGILDGQDRLGTLGGILGNDVLSSIVLPANGKGTDYNFGEICPAPVTQKCDTICWRSTQHFLNNIRYLPGGLVLIAGVNANNPVSIQQNLNAIRSALNGGPGAQQQLNKQFVTAQISIAGAGGNGSPVTFNTYWSPLRCSGVGFAPVTLSNGIVLTPETLLDTLVTQTTVAIKENRSVDYDELASVWALLNGRCAF